MSRIGEGAARAAAAWWRRNVRTDVVDESTLTRFEEELYGFLCTYDYRNLFLPDLILGVDYQPDPILNGAAKRAGLKSETVVWPWKTAMCVYPDRIEILGRHDARRREVYPRCGLHAIEEIVEREEGELD